MKAAEPTPFYQRANTQIPSASQIISEAKASLFRPSRPFTPAPRSRVSAKVLNEPLGPDFFNKPFLRKFAAENGLSTKLEPLEKPVNKCAPEMKRLASPKASKSPILNILSRPSTPCLHEQTEAYVESDTTPTNPPNSMIRSKSLAHLDAFYKLGPDNDQNWHILTNLVRKLVIYGELEPIYEYLVDSKFLRKYARPISSSRSRAARESKKLNEGSPLQQQDESDHIDNLVSFEKKARSALTKWLIEWCCDSECTDSIFVATCLLIRLTRDEENLELCLKKLFKKTMDVYQKPHHLVVESLAIFTKQHQVRGRSNVLIYACGIFRNWSEAPETHHMLLSNNIVPFFISVISELAAETTINLSPGKMKSCIDLAEISIYTRLISQIVVCLRNLNKNHELQYTPQLINDLCLFLLQSNRMNEDEHVVFMIVKLLGTLSESTSSQVTLGQPKFVEAFAQLLVRFIEQPAILTRLAYILGNLTTVQNATHAVLNNKFHEIITVFKKVHEDYTDIIKSETNSQIIKVYCDVFTKMTRLVANLSLDTKMGESMIKMTEFESLMTLTASAEQELSLNIIWLLANISFYATPGSRMFTNLYLGIPKIIPHLISDNEEMVTESCRILANLSRFPLPSPPQAMQNLMEVITLLLDHSRTTILELTCGILVNLLKSAKNIQYFISYNGHEKLFDLLEWGLDKEKKQLVALATQGIFNLRRNIDKQILHEGHIENRVLTFPPHIQEHL